VPVPSDAPPVEAAYQLIVPALALAPKTKVPVPQTVAGVVAAIVGIVLTVAITDDLLPVAHPLDVAST
jgi:hypothetical protein